MSERITTLARRVLPGLLLSLVAAAILAGPTPASAANNVTANLRVVTWKGKILFDGRATAGTTRVRSNATCLGGRIDPARTVAGPTALNLLVAASRKSKSLRPLRLTDSDYGFGICGIGGVSATGEEWWVLRTNYRDATVGAEGLTVKQNDSILLYLSRTWAEPTPDSLYLKAPAKARKGARVRVRVLSYNGAGRRRPVEGAAVKGAPALTDASGYTTLTVSRKTGTIARRAGLIPSNRAVIRIRRPVAGR